MDTLDSTSAANGSSTVNLGSDLGPLGGSPSTQASWEQALADVGPGGNEAADDMGWGNAGGSLSSAPPSLATTTVSNQAAPRTMGDATGLPGLDNMAEDGTALPTAADNHPATPAPPSPSQPESHWYDRPLGLLQAAGGVGEAVLGGVLLAAPEPTGLTKVGGVVVGLHGLDDIQAGLRTAWTDHPTQTVTQQAATSGAQALGANPGAAVVIGAVVDGGLGMANPEGGAGKVVRGAVELSEAERATQAGGEAARGVEGSTEAEKAMQAEAHAASNPPTVSSKDIADFRNRIGVPETNTAGVGRTNVPGLEGQVFEGASPAVRQQAGMPPATPGPIASPRTIAIDRNHAEEDIANQFVAAVDRAGLKPADLDGKELLMRVQNEAGICTACRQGLANQNVASGVLKQLSERYPGLNIRVVVDNPGPRLRGPADFTIRNGAYMP